MPAPLVSVVIPAYNAEATILETIASVRAQTHTDLEIIVIDDGSTDRTRQRVATVADDRLTLQSYPNAGLATARNRGVQHARGAFVSFIDADDLWTPDKLASQLAALERHPEAGLAYSWTVLVDRDGRFLFAKEPLHFEGDVRLPLLRECFIASGSNVLLRRRCIDAVGLFDPALRAAEDWDYWLRVAVDWAFVVVPRYHILYRVSAESMTADAAAVEHACLVVLERALQGAPVTIRQRRNEYVASIKHYVAFLQLTRATGRDNRASAGWKLLEAVRLDPTIVVRRKTFTLLCTWLLLRALPRRLAPAMMTALLRLHGRTMALLIPELRRCAVVRRL